jgi:arylsulfatase A-like enzyme
VGWVALVLALVVQPGRAQREAAKARKPNVLLIMTDDVGYGDIGVYGAPDVKTPNIDGLAREGVRLTDFYGAPQCTPARAALMTGRYPARVALDRSLSSVGISLDLGLKPTGRSLPRLLKNNGYATGLIGKWHLGYKPEYSPNAHGFDEFFGFLSGYIDYYTHTRGIDGRPDLFENSRPIEQSGYITDLITTRAVSFIERRAREPFFLEVAYSAAHWPFQIPDHFSKSAENARFEQPSDKDAPTRKDYVAMLERADAGVGLILKTLEKHGLAQDTLVIFTNDNGGEWLSRNAPLFHRKDTLWEGGIRVPTIVRWPTRVPASKTSGQVGITMDLTATILAATQTPLPANVRLDGMDLLPLLQDRAHAVERTLVWRINSPARNQWAVRQGDWKLLVDGDDLMLFNLREDISERNDLASQRPEIVRKLINLLVAWERDVDTEAQGALRDRR